MECWRKITILCVAFFGVGLFTACNRPLSNEFSTLTIKAPQANALGKVGALAALPANRKACYGVNVTGPGILMNRGNACSPETGVIAGFIESGQIIQASVPQGVDRKIELLVYLQAVGENLPCDQLGPAFTAGQILNTYIVGKATGVNMGQPVVEVEITLNFPGLANHIKQQLSLSDSCFVATNPSVGNSGFQISTGQGYSSSAAGAGIHLKARVGRVGESKVLTGTGYELHVTE